jgi:threonine synthase
MASFSFRCTECDTLYTEDERSLTCLACSLQQEPGGVVRGVLEIEIAQLPTEWPPLRFTEFEFLCPFLPISSAESLAPIQVGGTPLLPVPSLRRELGMPRLWVKDDTRNPSGSTKDRASLLVVARAIEQGLDTIATASTGNAATALAAVAASAGRRAVLFVPAEAPEAKLIQMLAYGAQVIRVDGSYDQAFELCLEACARFGWYNRNTALNPFTIEGKKTAALEIAAQLAPVDPEVVVVPTGDGVILAGLAKGFNDLVNGGLISRRPRLLSVQPSGSAAIVRALRAESATIEPVSDAASVADSLTVQVPRNSLLCLQRIRESRGAGVTVDDDAIVRAIGRLAGTTGVFAEPAGAAALAGLEQALTEHLVDRDEHVVLLVTGSGLKDVPSARRTVDVPPPISPELDAVARIVAAEGKDCRS